MSQTGFVRGDLELTAAEGRIETLRSVVETVVRSLRTEVDSDRRLETILRDGSGTESLERRDTVERETPERFTEERVIEPILDALEFSDRSQRPGDSADELREEADYAERVNGERVLIEAEPLNGDLDRRGVDQVEGWLENRRFDARYGIATNGIRWILLTYDEASYGFDTLADVDLREVFVRQFEAASGRANSLASPTNESTRGTSDRLARLIQFFERDNLATIVSRADDVIESERTEITEEFYREYVRLVFGIVDEETGETTARSLARGGVEVPPQIERDFENPRRLVAVSLMNRLVFVKFLEDRGLVEENLLLEMREDYEESAQLDDFYSAYLHPLFCSVFYRTPDEREGRADEYVDGTPYPNGGLFQPVLSHQVDPGESDYAPEQLVRLERRIEVSDSVLADVIDLLERYRFTADDGVEVLESGGVQTLDPSVLGNVFEKTINYLAGETGRQKDLGAFYTPDELTRFTAAETIRPIALERLQTALVERGWHESEVARHDTVDALAAALPPTADLEADLQAALDTITVCDPACGSGHFLTAVLGELMTIRKSIARNVREDPLVGRAATSLKKRTIRRNVFGVDVVAPAVEIAKLRLWLSVVADIDPAAIEDGDDGGLALPNVTFNVRVGNSLIGFPGLEARRGDEATLAEADLLETIPDYESWIETARRTRDGKEPKLAATAERREELIEQVDAAFARLVSDETFEDEAAIGTTARESVAATVNALADAADGASVSTIGFYVDDDYPLTDAPSWYTDETLDGLEFTAHKWKAKRPVSGRLTEAETTALVDAVANHPDEGVTEVYVERTVSNADLDALSRFHWPVEFPDAARNAEDGEFGFDVVIGNPPFGADIDGLEDVLVGREEFYTCHGANNSAEYFLERAVQLTRPGGRIGFVLPKTLSYYATWRDIRSKLLAESPPATLFDNGLAFGGVNYEQVTLIATPLDDGIRDDGDWPGGREVDTFVAEDLRDETANEPVRAGSVPLDAMRSRGTLVLRPMTERDREIVAALETDTTPLSDLWAEEPRRGVYVPDSRKVSLADGETPFVERVPSVQRYYLEAEGVWHIDVDDLPAKRRANALETMTPRLLFKVLRGSRLSVYPDATGRFASTEKLVNVPIRADGTPHTLRSLAAVLNSPVVSYYLQKLLFGETTETARVMDAAYVEDIPIPAVSDRRAALLDKVVENLLFAAQYVDDGYGGERAEEYVALLERIADALVADCYFELGADELRAAVDEALSTIAFDEWADDRFAAGGYPLEGARARWDIVEAGTSGLIESGVEAAVERIETHEWVERTTEVLDG